MAEDMAMAAASKTMADNVEVQKVSENSGGLPPRYVLREADRPVGTNSSHQLSASIPVVDLRLLSQYEPSSEEEMTKLRSALGSWGVFQATGHGIPTSLLNAVRSIGKQFFELPMEEKQRFSTKGEGFAEGYGTDGFDAEAQAVDWTDRVLLRVEPEDQRKLELWPDNPVSFRETLQDYVAKSKIAVHLILRAMAKSLDLEENHFISQLGEKMELFCRFCHYPSCPRSDLVLGLKPHSDISMLTLILQGGEVEGLELLKDDMWIRVPNNPDVLLVQMGDVTEIMSNGVFKSSVHRVVIDPNAARISTALFFGPDPEREIGPAEKLLRQGRREYRDLTVKDYLGVHFKSYSEGKRSIGWAKA